MKTIATICAGGGGVECGAIAAGLQPIWAIEYDAAIAGVHRANFPDTQVFCAAVQDVDPHSVERPDVLHASPPCPSFSVAKADGEETEEDIAIAEAVCRFLRVLTPPVFTLENVMGYRYSCSYQRILCTLDELGYWTHSDVLNAADYGVPQRRKRLILRAVRDGFPAPLPPKGRWIGWYEAIEDLIPTLPESRFAEWQLKRLPEEIMTFLLMGNFGGDEGGVCECERDAHTLTAIQRGGMPKAFLVDGGNARKNGPIHRLSERPAPTMTQASKPIALLIEGDAAGERCPTICEPKEPAFTVKAASGGRVHRAFLVDGKPANYEGELQIVQSDNPVVTLTASQEKHPFRAWLSEGRVVAMTPRALARFQSFLDTYILPDNKTLACRVIGNAVPPKLYETIIGGLM